jgi:hypothetical protein
MDRVLVFGTSDGGSIPSGRTFKPGFVAQLVERSPLKRLVAGSSPAGPTLFTDFCDLAYRYYLYNTGCQFRGVIPRRSVEIGRQARLRTVWSNPWRFKSSLRHLPKFSKKLFYFVNKIKFWMINYRIFG